MDGGIVASTVAILLALKALLYTSYTSTDFEVIFGFQFKVLLLLRSLLQRSCMMQCHLGEVMHHILLTPYS